MSKHRRNMVCVVNLLSLDLVFEDEVVPDGMDAFRVVGKIERKLD